MADLVFVSMKYSTQVATLTEAWQFVMARVDQVGPDPRVLISPVWRIEDDDTDTREFEVVVEGTTPVTPSQ